MTNKVTQRVSETRVFEGADVTTTVVSTPDAPDFLQLARDLRARRAEVEAAKTEVEKARQVMVASVQARALADEQETLAQRMAACTEAENALRRAALEQYLATGAKKFPGVSVKVGRKVTYQYEEAEAFVRAQMPALLILDRKAFETFVLSARTPPKCVTIEDDPKTAIATKLEGV